MQKKVRRFLGRSSKNPNATIDGSRPLTEAPPQPVFKQFLRVVDDSDHASKTSLPKNSQGEIFTMRGGWRSVGDLYRLLIRDEQLKAILDGVGWSQLFLYRTPNSDQRLVESCVERWWDTTHTFHLPYVELGITPYDFTFLTGWLSDEQKVHHWVLYLFGHSPITWCAKKQAIVAHSSIEAGYRTLAQTAVEVL